MLIQSVGAYLRKYSMCISLKKLSILLNLGYRRLITTLQTIQVYL